MPSRGQPEDVLHERFRVLERALPRALNGEPRAVHKARVASRRVREALPVALADAPPKVRRKLRRRVERVTRALGRLRELDVSLALLAEVAGEDSRTGAALDPLRLAMEAERRSQLDRASGKLDEVDVARLHARAGRGTDDRALNPHALSGIVVLLLRLTRRVQELEEAIEDAGPLYATERIHRVRIAVKKLRYAFELARDLRLLGSRRVLPRLRAMQETLGRLHDLQVLGARVDDFRSRCTPAEPVAPALDAVAARLEAECRALHARYLARREKLIASADEALADVASRAAVLREGPVQNQAIH